MRQKYHRNYLATGQCPKCGGEVHRWNTSMCRDTGWVEEVWGCDNCDWKAESEQDVPPFKEEEEEHESADTDNA